MQKIFHILREIIQKYHKFILQDTFNLFFKFLNANNIFKKG